MAQNPTKKIVIGVLIVGVIGAVAYLFKTKKVGVETSTTNSQAIYDKNCAVCHRIDGGGSAGPNLVDDYWIYGKNWEDVETFIANGNEDGGMPAYKNILKAEEIKAVTQYIRSLQGSNPLDAKAPQGFGYKMPN